TSCWRPGPATAAAWWRPSARAPRPTSPDRPSIDFPGPPLVGLAGHLMAAGPNQEVEVRALVGLHHVVDVQALPAPGRGRVAGDRAGGRLPPREVLRRDVDVKPPRRDVELDDVAGADQAQRAPGRGLRRDVQDDGAVGRAAHPAVADADHVAHASL